MNTDFFENNVLECDKSNPLYIQYLTGLKDLFRNVSKMVDEGKLDDAKESLMNKYGDFSPDLYKVSSEVNEIFLGQLKEQTIEIYLRFRIFYQELSSERVSDLTGSDINISINRLKLFLNQEVRDIDKILN